MNKIEVKKDSGLFGNPSFRIVSIISGIVGIGIIFWVLLSPKVPEGMAWIPPGEFFMGDDSDREKYADALPVHKVRLQGFYIDKTEVTNSQYQKFVDATGYKTIAERPLDPKEFPDVPPEKLVPGAGVFSPPIQEVVDCSECNQWWKYKEGVCWKNPEGKDSNYKGRENHPVVYVAWEDAAAYCKWAGKRLPTEAEWEYAARGNSKTNNMYPWGSPYTRTKEGRLLANFKPGRGDYFGSDAKNDNIYTSKVQSYPENAYKLFDMAGNVAEWTSSVYYEGGYNFMGDFSPDLQYNAKEDDPISMKRKVVRGGSWKDIAYNIQVSTRNYEYQDTAKSYIGFRCVLSMAPRIN
jgi:formylglycine-generating enzyme required for sulfatase activity